MDNDLQLSLLLSSPEIRLEANKILTRDVNSFGKYINVKVKVKLVKKPTLVKFC